jgi:soluble lytic murein transglycosylase
VHDIIYPLAFDTLISEEAQRRSVDPSIIRAIIRQESIYDPKIVSPVGAIGLMQIMPATGKEIASDLDEPFVKDSLYSAATNVRYGCFYFRQLLEQFEGNIVLALAAYNGGPHNAKRWFEANRNESFDMFIENISYTETRRYVKKVLSNYWTYNRLAGVRSSLPRAADGSRP